MSKESFSAVLITQGKHRFYTMTMPIDVLASTCFITSREEDPEEGFQRKLDIKRAEKIAEYIDHGFGVIPTSIILSAQLDANFEYDSKVKVASFLKINKAFMILDGQHRVYGFKKAKSTLRVPVVVFSGLSRSDEAKLFIDINTEQKPVPNELLLDIKSLARYEKTEEIFVRQLFDYFDEESNSCMKGLMSSSSSVKGKVSRVTFKRAINSILSRILDNEPLPVFLAMNNYLHAFKLIFSELTDSNKIITNPTVFTGTLSLFPKVMRIVSDRYNGEHSLDNFMEVLKPIATNLKPLALTKPPASYLKFSEHLEGLLEKESLRF